MRLLHSPCPHSQCTSAEERLCLRSRVLKLLQGRTPRVPRSGQTDLLSRISGSSHLPLCLPHSKHLTPTLSPRTHTVHFCIPARHVRSNFTLCHWVLPSLDPAWALLPSGLLLHLANANVSPQIITIHFSDSSDPSHI